jgi:hypothetical protein
VHLSFDVNVSLPPLEHLVVFGLLFVLFCVWTVALGRAWRRKHL